MRNLETQLQNEGFTLVVGVDEAGRAPLAGPVVAAAVALEKTRFSIPIRDSKQLSPARRELLFEEIYQSAHVGVGIISEQVIDDYDILTATFWAMHNAVRGLVARLPAYEYRAADFNQRVCVLIDGPIFRSELPYAVRTIVRGDENIRSIACASIIAKVTRDRILNIYNRVFPGYGFNQHKGYPTPAHKKAIRRLGPSLIHRRTFRWEV